MRFDALEIARLRHRAAREDYEMCARRIIEKLNNGSYPGDTALKEEARAIEALRLARADLKALTEALI